MRRVFIKIGGSLITNKQIEKSFHVERTRHIAGEIAGIRRALPDLQLLIGHGSGSFGHFAANRHGTIDGVHTPEQWRGFAEVATVASELNYLVAKEFHEAGIPVWRLQPSTSALCNDGQLIEMSVRPIHRALEQGLVPLVYGDVALDQERGGTIISTEQIMAYLVQHIALDLILLLGEVAGVLDQDGVVIPLITPANIEQYASTLGGSGGIDVTGGMSSKVSDMLSLVEQHTQTTIRIMDGRQPELLTKTIVNNVQSGTAIRA